MEIRVVINDYPHSGDFVTIEGVSAQGVADALKELEKRGVIELPDKEG